ncbi:hypothetical protein TESG_08221 [Trichophyton tonsurans CBS 112818]|uniref:Uncharacterized protein n=1 Tax=Trichophyton tonsurans (strain CBS 112818) TaxID=647933 RepID=F2SBI4_TRIT1|nr:hypothetical protein TESG_08221 [Trichophyton tonsurans CBS 112818]
MYLHGVQAHRYHQIYTVIRSLHVLFYARVADDAKRLCIPRPLLKDALQLAHDHNGHVELRRSLQILQRLFFVDHSREVLAAHNIRKINEY